MARKEEEFLEKDVTFNKEVLFWVGLIVVIVIILALAFITVGYKVKVCYIEQVPTTETYIVSEPYTNKECYQEELKYAMLDEECNSDGFLGLKYRITCSLHNLDTEGGEFIMEAGGTKVYMDGSQKDMTANIGGYFYPNEKKSYAYVFDMSLQSCWCKLIKIPTKQVCVDVIKYKDVQKERTVMENIIKNRNEVRQCSLWKKLMGNCYDTTEGAC